MSDMRVDLYRTWVEAERAYVRLLRRYAPDALDGDGLVYALDGDGRALFVSTRRRADEARAEYFATLDHDPAG